MNNNTKNDNTTEIDLVALFRTLIAHLPFLLVVTIVFGAATWAYTKFKVTPKYQTTVSMYASSVANKESNNISSSEQVASSRLPETYAYILGSNRVMGKVSNRLLEEGLHYSYKQLMAMTDVTTTGTEIFTITVTGVNQNEMKLVADTIADVAIEEFIDITEGGRAKVVDYAVPPTAPSSPSVMRNTVIGALLGLVLASAIIIVRALTDTKVWTEEDLSKQFDIPVLGTIPKITQQDRPGQAKE